MTTSNSISREAKSPSQATAKVKKMLKMRTIKSPAVKSRLKNLEQVIIAVRAAHAKLEASSGT